MMNRTSLQLGATFLALLSIAGNAGAQENAPGEPNAFASSPRVPDATYRAVMGRAVALGTRGGVEIAGRLLADDAQSVTLVLGSGEVHSFAKDDVVRLHLIDVAGPVAVEVPTVALAAPPPDRERHFAINLGLSPAVDLDVDYGRFHGFASANIILPMATAGSLLGFSAGAGVSLKFSERSRWRLDIFAHVSPARVSSDQGIWLVGFGAGMGAHYTHPSGFTLGFKVPILGYSACAAEKASQGPGYYSWQCDGFWNSSGGGVSGFYLSGLMGLPVVSLGYRF